MKKNLGNIDRVIRIILAIVFVTLSYTGIVTGILGTILLIVATVFVLTSFVSFCPLYAVLGFNTCPAKSA